MHRTENRPAHKHGICTNCSFGRAIIALGPLSEAVATFAARCAAKLRKQGAPR